MPLPIPSNSNGHHPPDPAGPIGRLLGEPEGTAMESRESHLAMLNVLEDFHEDRLHTAETNWAILNILDDFDADKRLLSDTNRAVINILEDLEEAKAKTEALNAELEVRVTERTAELAHSEERFRLLVEGVKDYAIFMVATDGSVATWNAGAERIKGYRGDEIIGKSFGRFYTAEDISAGLPQKHLRHAMAEGHTRDEGWRVRKDGSKFVADVLLTAIRDESGHLLGLVQMVRDITERKAAEVKAREASRQEMLLKEIHHRIKNNLQVISSLLYLQSTNVKDQNTLAILAESQSRVKSIALIHEKLYRSRDLERLAFGDYLHDLLSEMMRTYGVRRERIALLTDIKEVYLGIDTAVPCGLIVNELVSNALKHAFPVGGEGEIRIDLRPTEDDRYVLRVHDNGVGLPSNVQWQKSKSLGLKLVTDLTKQLGGSVRVDSQVGTAFEITFAELRYKERG